MPVYSEKPQAKILLIWDRIGDYHAARFRALETIAGKGNVLIADLGGADKLYQWKNPLHDSPYYFPLSQKPVEEADTAGRMRAVRKLVREHNIRIAGISGYGRPEYRAMLHWCRLNGIQVVLFAESWYPGRLDWLKGWYLKSLCTGFLVSGERAKEHFSSRLAIPGNRIFIPYSVVDNRHFSVSQPDYSAQKLLCVARFSEEKNLRMLVEAFAQSGIASKGWKLELVGGGPQKQLLTEMAGEGIVFREWVAYEDLPALYASASFFILPSSFEPWGLVVNEAMAAGLPIALSEECGCAPDLLSDEKLRFSAKSPDLLVAILRHLAQYTAAELQQMGLENRERIHAFSPEAWAEAFLEAGNISPS